MRGKALFLAVFGLLVFAGSGFAQEPEIINPPNKAEVASDVVTEPVGSTESVLNNPEPVDVAQMAAKLWEANREARKLRRDRADLKEALNQQTERADKLEGENEKIAVLQRKLNEANQVRVTIAQKVSDLEGEVSTHSEQRKVLTEKVSKVEGERNLLGAFVIGLFFILLISLASHGGGHERTVNDKEEEAEKGSETIPVPSMESDVARAEEAFSQRRISNFERRSSGVSMIALSAGMGNGLVPIHPLGTTPPLPAPHTARQVLASNGGSRPISQPPTKNEGSSRRPKRHARESHRPPRPPKGE